MTTCDLFKVLTFVVILRGASLQVIFGGGDQSLPTFIVTGPKRARYDAMTSFSVSASNVAEPARIQLVLRTGQAWEITLAETTLQFVEDGVQTWGVIIESATMIELQQSDVQLRAVHNQVDKVMDIPMNPLSGFIMIQTDKVIYTPRQTVMYRVIALDDDQRFAQWPVTVDIKNPDLIILERQHHSSREAFVGKNFTLPRDATQGTWSITAYYDDSKVRTTKTINFDVQEYVLPTFKVTVSAVEKVIALSTNWVQVKTKAVYSYGRPVHGDVTMRLGVIGRSSIALFNISYSDTLDDSGEWNFNVPVADLRGHSAWFPDGSRLFIQVNVTEEGTGEVGRAVATDTFFANPFYQISFDASKGYFKPGFVYTLVLDVKAANGAPAAGIHVYLIAEIKNEDLDPLPEGFQTLFPLDENGRLVHRISIPPEAEGLKFQVYTVDPKAPDWAYVEKTIHKFASTSDQYLHLQYMQNVSSLILSYTPPSMINGDAPEMISLLVVSRNHLIHTGTVQRSRSGTTQYPLSQDVLLAAAPKARVVAYFYVSGLTTEVVSDSLLIDTPDSCREEMDLAPASMGMGDLHLQPKQTTRLNIIGGPHMEVGLLAVDKAVYFLRDERSLTREKMFSALGEADEGRDSGDARNTDTIFEHAGLQYIKLTAVREVLPPLVDSSLDLSGLNFFPDVRKGNVLVDRGPIPEEEIPLDMVRRYFPESWLFREVTLPGMGFLSEEITLPDSVTTWVFTAVGVGADGGVCMTNPLELRAFKPFFAQVRLPYKAVRLESVTINIGIYNYQRFDINVTVTVTADLGLCFSDSPQGQDSFVYMAQLRAEQTNSETVRVIPLVAGNIKLTVDVRANNGRERDIVERTLYVVAEGRRVQKAITFPLDPSGQHSSHQPMSEGVQESETATITNQIYGASQQQLTHIRLYMPEEVIHGTERCQISACGDLMGDIISVSVLEGDNLFESSIVDAEEAIGNLAPSVHALLYLNNSQFMTPFMLAKGQVHVKHGVSRLLTYRKPDGSFSLTRDSPSATWLTALVLKTLCQAEQITFVDHESLVMGGFAWLLDQVQRDGRLQEQDRRLAQPSHEYDLMLAAETLIALHECAESRYLTADDLQLMGRQELLLTRHLNSVRSPLVMAKAAYALTLSDPTDEDTLRAVRLMNGMKRTNILGHHYWSVSAHENDPPIRPFWYHSGSKASSIEATAYALLVLSKQTQAWADYAIDYPPEEDEEDPYPHQSVNLDSVAGWLIQKRNSRGAFIGAMDTSAAIQALSEYSRTKVGVSEVNLHCNVTTNPTHNYSHSFDFNVYNAIMPKSLSNVPVGRQLLVETRGTGLGQMQVRVEYNVPVELNADCRYNVTINPREVSPNPLRWDGDEMCQYCNMGCDDNESPGNSERRQKRQISASGLLICIEVCLRSTDNMYADRTILDIAMLSGFQPIAQDLEAIYAKRERLALSSLTYVEERVAVEMKFNQIPHDRSTCVSFRAIERSDVERRNPAIVTVRSHEDPEPTCVHTYDPVVSEVNLEVYCANNRSNNQGQCRCFSGLCGQCITRSDEVSFRTIRELTCASDYIYKINPPSPTSSDDWINMSADIVSISKNGTVAADGQIQLVTPRSCTCPHRAGFTSPHFFFGSQVDIFVDRNNHRKKTYVVDQTATFVSSSFYRHSQDPDRTETFINTALQSYCPREGN